jgi:hypothetical protein
MIRVGQRRYIYDFKNREAAKGDKIVVRTKTKTVSGFILNIGTKYLELEVAPRLLYQPKHCGKSVWFCITRIPITAIDRIALYPRTSQHYVPRLLRNAR